MSCDADGHVYRVAIGGGIVAMPRLRAFPGDLGLIPNGTPVRVDHSLGEPYIDGILPPEGRRTEGRREESVTGVSGYGGQDPNLARSLGATARAGDEPNDLLPGDTAVRGPGGGTLALGHGPLAMLGAGPLAQLRMFGGDDHVQLIAGVLSVLTWMGEAKITNDNGKTSFTWRGGSDQLTQTGPDESRYTIHLDVGHLGDLVNFEITTPRGQTLFRWHVSAEGRLEVFAAGGIDQTDGGSVAPVRVAGDRETQVVGRDTTRVGGAASAVFEGGRRTEVSGNDTLAVGQDRSTTVLRDDRVTVAGRGGYTYGSALDVTVTAGDQTYRTRAGGYTVDATGGGIRLKTTIADGVKLGRNPRFHAVNYEELRAQFEALLTDYNGLKALVAGHVHGVGPTAPTLVPLAGQQLRLDLDGFKNQDVVL